ncbi:MAG: Verru_Chthon cassette protein D [Verrucomicrobiota bacterium]
MQTAGFTLVELLIVVAVIGIVLALTLPGLTNLDNVSLTDDSRRLTAALEKASETAMIEDSPIGIRFYSKSDQNSTKGFVAYQLVRLSQNPSGISPTLEEQAFADLESLSEGIVIVDEERFSSIVTDSDLACDLATADTNQFAKCFGFEFLPNGETTLPINQTPDGEPMLWFLTLASKKALAAQDGDLPSNFITIAVDPSTGALRQFQP